MQAADSLRLLPSRLTGRMMACLFSLGAMILQAQTAQAQDYPLAQDELLTPPLHVGIAELKAPPVAQLGLSNLPLELPEPWEWSVPEASIPLSWQMSIVRANWLSPLLTPLLQATALKAADLPDRWAEAETTAFFTHRVGMLWRVQDFANAEQLLQTVPQARRDAAWDALYRRHQLLQGKMEDYCRLLESDGGLNLEEDQLKLACQASKGAFREALLSLEVMREQGKPAPDWLTKYIMELAEPATASAYAWPKTLPLGAIHLTRSLPNIQLPASVFTAYQSQPESWAGLSLHPALPTALRLQGLEALATEQPTALASLQQAYAGVTAEGVEASPAQQRALFWQQWSKESDPLAAMQLLEDRRELFAARPLLWLATYGQALATRANVLEPSKLSERQQAMVILSLLSHNQHYLASTWMQATGRGAWLDQLEWLEEGLSKVTRKDGISPLQRQLEHYAGGRRWPELATVLLAGTAQPVPQRDWTVVGQALVALGQEEMAESWQRQQFILQELQALFAS